MAANPWLNSLGWIWSFTLALESAKEEIPQIQQSYQHNKWLTKIIPRENKGKNSNSQKIGWWVRRCLRNSGSADCWKLEDVAGKDPFVLLQAPLTVPAPGLHSYLFYSPVPHHHLWASVSLSPIIMCPVSHVCLHPSLPLKQQSGSLYFLLPLLKVFSYIPMYPFPFCGYFGS